MPPLLDTYVLLGECLNVSAMIHIINAQRSTLSWLDKHYDVILVNLLNVFA